MAADRGFGADVLPRIRSSFLLLAISYFAALTSVYAAPELPPLPGGAQPGGAQPQELFVPPTLDPSEIIFEVPPVFQRPLGVEEGARVFVKSFEITGVVDDPDADISITEIDERVNQRLADITELVEQLRVERQDQTDVDEDGFTSEERKRIIEFMRDVVKDLSPDRQEEGYRSFVDELRLQKLDRDKGLTIGQLQLVADEITNYYRERGFFLARAVIPAQEVVDGVVTIRVMEGRLGDVLPENNQRFSAQKIRSPFRGLYGELVTVDKIEDALLTLGDYPGLSASGIFRPGGEVGTADLAVNIQQEKRYEAVMRADNHGTEFTGRNRFIADLALNNPTKSGDLFGVTALQSFNPDNATFGGIRYMHPIGGPRTSFMFEASRNSFEVFNVAAPTSGSDVGGVSEIASISIRHNVKRNRQKNLNFEFDLNRKRADTESQGQVVNRDDLATFGTEFQFEIIHPAIATISSGLARVDIGLDGKLGVPDEDFLQDFTVEPQPSRRSGSEVSSSNFEKVSLNYALLKSLGPNQTFQLRFAGQWSNDLLSSLEQFVIGGPTTVRAIPTSQFLTDSGMYASMEWSIRAPGFANKRAFGNRTWGDIFRLKIFTDYALGWTNIGPGQQRNASNERVSIGGDGIGLEFGIPGKFAMNFQWAKLKGGKRLGTSATDVRAIRDDTQFWIDISADF